MRYYIANLSSRYLTKKERTAMTNCFAACMIARMCMPMGMGTACAALRMMQRCSPAGRC